MNLLRYNHKGLSQMPSKLPGTELIQLKNAVVENFDASNWRELGALTNTIDEVENHPRLLRSLNWKDPDYDGLALVFIRTMIGPNDENLAVVRGYIAEKCETIGEDVSSEKVVGRKIVFSPNIFTIPSETLDTQLVSVMMPFNPVFGGVYSAISDAATMAGFTCKRVDDIWNHSTVIQDIFSLIFCSFIVVCDFSSKNPNVFYEAGIAHTLGKHVVPITQSEYDIPFDLQHHRYVKYLNNGEGLENLKRELYLRFLTLDGMRR